MTGIYYRGGLEFYKNRGYTYKEVPWYVPVEYVKETFSGTLPHSTEYGVLVGSAEQSLIYGLSLGLLGPDKYMAVTPCFRSDLVDLTHTKSFVKLELFVPMSNSYHDLMKDAKEFFGTICDKEITICLGGHANEEDIKINEIEVGSYGYRSNNKMHWSYGTGLALPRFSVATNEPKQL